MAANELEEKVRSEVEASLNGFALLDEGDGVDKWLDKRVDSFLSLIESEKVKAVEEYRADLTRTASDIKDNVMGHWEITGNENGSTSKWVPHTSRLQEETSREVCVQLRVCWGRVE